MTNSQGTCEQAACLPATLNLSTRSKEIRSDAYCMVTSSVDVHRRLGCKVLSGTIACCLLMPSRTPLNTPPVNTGLRRSP